MSYIGNQQKLSRHATTAEHTSLTGDGSTTTWPLPFNASIPAYLFVAVDGALKEPTSDYTINTTGQIVFTSPPANLAKIQVRNLSTLPNTATVSHNTVDENRLTQDVRDQLHLRAHAARNCVLNQEAVDQTETTATGFSSTIYTGNGSSQSVNTGVDMTGDNGGLVWIKNRDASQSHLLTDSVRGTSGQLRSSDATTEGASAIGVTSFDASGFSIGSQIGINDNTNKFVVWTWQTNKKTSGVTNRNKAYTAHYNTGLGFSIVGFVGDGVRGHEIPHHLSVKPELSIYKARSAATDWHVLSSLFPQKYLSLNSSIAGIGTVNTYDHIPDVNTVILNSTWGGFNPTDAEVISYHFTSVPGVSKIGKYIGNGAVGTHIDCGFGSNKPAWVMVKNITTAGNWVIVDNIRGVGDDNSKLILANLTNNEQVGVTSEVDFVPGGFTWVNSSVDINTVNDEYIFLAFAETSIDATKTWTDYSHPTTPDTLNIKQNSVLSFANGFNVYGAVNNVETIASGITHTLGAGYENKKLYLYKDKDGSYGTTEFIPLAGITRNDADKWGVESPRDPSLRTTVDHTDYESSTGVVSASTENASYPIWSAFFDTDIIGPDFTQWLAASTTTSWVQYKFTEKRVLKSWRMRDAALSARLPKRFTIEGSNDGLNWDAVDSTYTASDYIGNGISSWGDLQDTSGNTTAYLYYRMNITANSGDVTWTAIADLEFNTILPSDYYLVDEGKMYDSNDTVIERVYLAEITTDSDGEVSYIKNFPVGKINVGDIDVHRDLTVQGDIEVQHNLSVQRDLSVQGDILSNSTFDAWVYFDGSVTPPLIHASKNIADVVEIQSGVYECIFDVPMDLDTYITLSGGVQNKTAPYYDRPIHAHHINKYKFKVVCANYIAGSNNVSPPQVAMAGVVGGKAIK